MEPKLIIGMVYVGNGAYLAPIPARDLSVEEVKAFGKEALLKTGLYQEPKKETDKPAPKNYKES